MKVKELDFVTSDHHVMDILTGLTEPDCYLSLIKQILNVPLTLVFKDKHTQRLKEIKTAEQIWEYLLVDGFSYYAFSTEYMKYFLSDELPFP